MTIPLQHFGLGDIIFTQTLVKQLAEGEVVWPVELQFYEGLNNAYPDVTFIPKTFIKPEIFDIRANGMYDGVKILPLRWADTNLRVPYASCMRAKYDFFGLDYKTWKKDAMPKRNYAKENKLYDAYNIKEPYNLVNKFFMGNSSGVVDIVPQNGLRTIQMGTIEGYSLFDWIKLIIEAENIYTVSTSIVFLLEILDLKAKEIHLYPRVPYDTDFRNIKDILTKNYILHG